MIQGGPYPDSSRADLTLNACSAIRPPDRSHVATLVLALLTIEPRLEAVLADQPPATLDVLRPVKLTGHEGEADGDDMPARGHRDLLRRETRDHSAAPWSEIVSGTLGFVMPGSYAGSRTPPNSPAMISSA